jgi:phosphoglycolate phosphatase-like HAD superfamily hydrolase
MLDVDILTLMLRKAGISRGRIPALLPDVRRAAEFSYRKQCGDLRDRVIPGVTGLLAELKRRRVQAGLVTGNLRRIGWRKVERAGLRESFVLGAFSGEGKTRAALAIKAMGDARRKGYAGKNTKVVLIGDTPNDIEAARIAGIPCVATATGVYPAGELEPHRPTLLVTGLHEVSAERLAGL